MAFQQLFHGPNAGYVQQLYQQYLSDPRLVDDETRRIFEQWQPPEPDGSDAVQVLTDGPISLESARRLIGGVNYAEAIRDRGHLSATTLPLADTRPLDPTLHPSAHGIQESDMRGLPAALVGGPLAQRSRDALEAIQALKLVYMGATGYQFDHIDDPGEREWLRFAAEAGAYRPPQDIIDPLHLLQRLTEVEAFERFIHRVFPGKHRFSIEGLDMLVPMLDEAIGAAAEAGVRTVLFGMAHRGRLNMLAHILGKPYSAIFAEFRDPVQHHKFRDDLGWTGDVKYHLGARRALQNGRPVELIITMAPNPSHLEFVNPVVEGMARAAGTYAERPGEPRFNSTITLPIVIHGDAAFPGQGIVAETLNLSMLPGYWTGGTLHVIANNQLGYTTEPSDSRSTKYASDLAKGFDIPIVHVNADDPEACIEAARLACAYIFRYQRDFVIDLIGYRRHGHNEGDEPAFTQPVLYQIIEGHPTVRALWAQSLANRGVIEPEEAESLYARQIDQLQLVLEDLNVERDLIDQRPVPPEPGTARRTRTSVAIETLRQLNTAILTLPEGFSAHPKLARILKRRAEQSSDDAAQAVDFAHAEALAFASVLADGIPIRITGQDVERGTFSQRHAVLHDHVTDQRYVPLQALPQAHASFEIHNSPLSEAAAVGFEYGYNVQEPARLVLWEAQYGDFDNGAQVIIDEFIVSARAKWGQTPSIVLLLPHGYEGAGPDHSSARLERFLQLAAETNTRIANPTTAAQYFHLLRRQAVLLKTDPLPLVVLTPKSLLRHPLVSSSLNDLAEGSWQPILGDLRAEGAPGAVRRAIVCSGKLGLELAEHEWYRQSTDTAVLRIEQLYPFPTEELKRLLDSYPALNEIVWAQEEPENMGAWEFVRPILIGLAVNRSALRVVARPRNASPSEGSSAWHSINQVRLYERAFNRPSASPIAIQEG